MSKPAKRRTKLEWIEILNSNHGKTAKEIAIILKISKNGVHAAIKRHRLYKLLKAPVRRKEYWLKVHNDNLDLSYKQISKKLGINLSTLYSGFYVNDIR